MPIVSTALASALIGGAASLGGAGLSGLMGRSNAKQAYEFNKDMYKNRHQWEVQDLRAAGLNPILSAGGQPPSPTTAAAPTPDFSSVGRDAVSAASASSAREVQKAQKAMMEFQAEQADTAAQKNRAEAREAENRANLTQLEYETYRNNPKHYFAKLLQPNVSREAEAAFDLGKKAWDNSGLGSMFNALSSAKKAHANAERMEDEVRKRYPNMKRE